MNPKVSILTTVYNSERFISQSIESILNQTFKDFEFIIIDDGSNDKTAHVIKKYAAQDKRIIFVENGTNLGRVKSLNKGLEIIKGKYIALQDADDISLPERLERQFSFLENNPGYILVGTNIIVVDEFENFISRPLRPINNLDAKFSLLFRCTFANPSIMFSKRIVDEHSLRYEENFIFSEDFRFISLISQYGNIYNLELPLVKYRRHNQNNSMLHFEVLNLGTIITVKGNLATLGINIKDEQVNRIRNLIVSRGIEKEYLYEDVKLILQSVKVFQDKYENKRNNEILKILRRMQGWLGKKNILFKPKFFVLYVSILTKYVKQYMLSRD